MRQQSDVTRTTADETGAVLAIVAFSLVALLGIAALAVDGGFVFNERRRAQNAADHAALAAAWASCHGEDPNAAAATSVADNGYHPSQLTLTPKGVNQFEARIDSTSEARFARILGFDTTDLAARAAAECDASGGSDTTIFAGGDSCASFGKPQLDISGSTEVVNGAVHSNDNVGIGGSTNDFNGPFTYVSSINISGSDNQFAPGYPALVPAQPWPVTFELSTYQSLALTGAAGYFFVDGDIDGTFIEANGSGLYYATGNIVLDKEVDLDVTLVAEGTIVINASNQRLDPFVDGLLAFGGETFSGIDQCDKFVVSMAGSTNAWTGLIYGPRGLVEFNGSDNTTLTGSLIGYSVKLNGSVISITNDPDLFPPRYSVELKE